MCLCLEMPALTVFFVSIVAGKKQWVITTSAYDACVSTSVKQYAPNLNWDVQIYVTLHTFVLVLTYPSFENSMFIVADKSSFKKQKELKQKKSASRYVGGEWRS